MTAPAWTPGPWAVTEENHRLYVSPVRSFDGEIRACSYPRLADFHEPKSGAGRGMSPRWHGFDAETRANAALIAAAPELYAALVAARDMLAATWYDNGETLGGPDLLACLDAALAKARGEP